MANRQLGSGMSNRQLCEGRFSKFHVNKVSFLVYVISSEGVSIDTEKVAAVTSWPTPTTIEGL